MRRLSIAFTAYCLLLTDLLVAHTGLEPVISALRGQRVNQLHQCAVGRIIELRMLTGKSSACEEAEFYVVVKCSIIRNTMRLEISHLVTFEDTSDVVGDQEIG